MHRHLLLDRVRHALLVDSVNLNSVKVTARVRVRVRVTDEFRDRVRVCLGLYVESR